MSVKRTPAHVYHTKACQSLMDSRKLPFMISHEKIYSNTTTPWCTHDIGMELVVFISGHGTLRTDDIVHQTTRGAVCLIPPGVNTHHQANNQEHIEYLNFIFLEDQLKINNMDLSQTREYKYLTNFQGKDSKRLSPVVYLDSELINEIELMSQIFISKQTFQSPNWQLYCSSVFIYLLGRILIEYHNCQQQLNAQENRIEKIANYIERNCTQSFSRHTLAKKFAISTSSLSQLFKKVKGIPPIEYAIRCRLQKAIHMFGYSKDINRIASECGFIDLAYFSRAFRSRLGITPRQFKNLSYEEQSQYSSKLKNDLQPVFKADK